MKKTVSALIALVILFSLSACTLKDSAKHEMYIQKAELTQQEQAILEFAGVEKPPYILEFAVNDTVQSLQINTYELQNGKWHLLAGGGGQQFEESKGRIALSFDNIGLGLRTAVEHKGSTSFQAETAFDFKGLATTTSFLTDETAIEFEKELPLVIQIHTSKNEISSRSPADDFYEPQAFADAGHEKVYAITCLFSEKTANELSQ